MTIRIMVADKLCLF
uniref:Uncharacterized protein n=1 Tax=Rhizophora mucronata TaxID=61149 RepID=A0A2P2J7U8_RHIMU